jgi:hypothetical protein
VNYDQFRALWHEILDEAGLLKLSSRPRPAETIDLGDMARIYRIFRANLPLDSPLPMPEAEAWRRWVAEASS